MANPREYRFMVRFNGEEVEALRKSAGDAPLPTYIRKAALRDAERRAASFAGKPPGDPFEGKSGSGGGG